MSNPRNMKYKKLFSPQQAAWTLVYTPIYYYCLVYIN